MNESSKGLKEVHAKFGNFEFTFGFMGLQITPKCPCPCLHMHTNRGYFFSSKFFILQVEHENILPKHIGSMEVVFPSILHSFSSPHSIEKVWFVPRFIREPCYSIKVFTLDIRQFAISCLTIMPQMPLSTVGTEGKSCGFDVCFCYLAIDVPSQILLVGRWLFEYP